MLVTEPDTRAPEISPKNAECLIVLASEGNATISPRFYDFLRPLPGRVEQAGIFPAHTYIMLGGCLARLFAALSIVCQVFISVINHYQDGLCAIVLHCCAGVVVSPGQADLGFSTSRGSNAQIQFLPDLGPLGLNFLFLRSGTWTSGTEVIRCLIIWGLGRGLVYLQVL